MNNHSSQGQSEDVWSRPNWPPCLEKTFVELLIEEMKNHLDVIPSGFKDEVWDRVCKEFHEETGKNYDKLELKKHLAVLRKRYRIVKPLYNHGGFGWDYRRKMVDVDDCIWAEYIEVHPDIVPYRKWGCPIYEELCTIFTRPKATGEYATSIGSYSSGNGCFWRSMGSDNITKGRNKRQFAEPVYSVPSKRSNKGSDNPIANATTATGTASDSSKSAMAHKVDPYSIDICSNIINGMQGVDRRLYIDALDLLKNPIWRETFVSLRAEKRLGWLKAMLPGV